MRRVDAVLYMLAAAGVGLLVVAALLYEPAERPDAATGPTQARPTPDEPPCPGPCLEPWEVRLDAASGHDVWRWDREVLTSSLVLDGQTPVLGIGWTRDEEVVLEAAVMAGRTLRTHGPLYGFSPVPAADGTVYLRGVDNAKGWHWRTGNTDSIPNMTVPMAAHEGRLLGVCGQQWCIHDGETQVLPLPAGGRARAAGALDGDAAYVAWQEEGATVLYRVGGAVEEVARGDFVRVVAHDGRIAWEKARGGATILHPDGTREDVPEAATIAWAGDRLVYVVRGDDGQSIVRTHPGGQEVARFVPREDVQAVAGTPGAAWLAGTVFVDGENVDILMRVPLN